MDWESALGTFFLVFLAELGDKTQLLLLSMSARSRSPQMIFIGGAAALIASSLVAVLAGGLLLKAVPLRAIRIGTGTAFLGIGGLLIFRAMR